MVFRTAFKANNEPKLSLEALKIAEQAGAELGQA